MFRFFDKLGQLNHKISFGFTGRNQFALHAENLRIILIGDLDIALPHLHEGDVIINTGSITGLDGNSHLIDYSATKGAIHVFTKSLAGHLIKRRIRVNCVAPGPVWTPLNPSDKPAEKVAQFGSETAMGRPAQPDEIAPTYVFLASEADSSYINGEVITLLGGTQRAA